MRGFETTKNCECGLKLYWFSEDGLLNPINKDHKVQYPIYCGKCRERQLMNVEREPKLNFTGMTKEFHKHPKDMPLSQVRD